MQQYDRFDGVIGRTQAESTPWWPTPPHPGAGAPNVVVILLDDTGFSHFGCYGSDLTTPNIDPLADGGLRYTNFHVTPLCSPDPGVPADRTQPPHGGHAGHLQLRQRLSAHARATSPTTPRPWPRCCATRATPPSPSGKWHLCAMENASAAGPYDQWPCQRGFDRFYGFLEGETDQFSPELVYDNHRVEPPATPDEGYHLSEDLVDHAIGFIHDTVSIRPDRPFFTYLAFGAMHAPHQAPGRVPREVPGPVRRGLGRGP